VDDFFRELGLRDDVLERLETATGMSPSRRREALDIAGSHPEDASALSELAWDLVKSPGRGAADYRRARRCALQACRLDPDKGVLLTTLGVAYYRIGDDEKAVETLERSSRARPSQAGASEPADLAFLAMAQHRLGHLQAARESLNRLREGLKGPRRAQDALAQSFLQEAESLVAPAPSPAGK
jgi:tetratricopeptide (TPR) repeat protein